MALVDGENQHREGLSARLISPYFTLSEEIFCFHFWFSLSGPNISTLRVLKGSNDGEQLPLWELAASEETDLSSEWIEAQTQYKVS